MSLCGLVQQQKTIIFRACDNKERENAVVHAVMHVGKQSEDLDIKLVNDTKFCYEITWSHNELGVGILEVFFDNEQIPQSPVRVQVTERDCKAEFQGQGKEANSNGDCVCGKSNIRLFGKCIASTIVFVVIAVIVLLVAGEVGYLYLNYRQKQSDQVWHIKLEALHFSDPVEVIGRGSFGVVLLAGTIFYELYPLIDVP